jgi:pimeloyl-ACP methyl ester carboxylesterase
MRGIAQGLIHFMDKPANGKPASEISRRLHGIVRICLYMAILIPVGAASARAEAVQRPAAHSPAHVYFFTGLIGGIGSSLDPLDANVRRHGLRSSMTSPGNWSEMENAAVADYRAGRTGSVIIVGYSIGATLALQMASELNDAGIPVSLVLTIDGVPGTEVRNNVRSLVNVYQRGGFGNAIARPRGYGGNLQNVAILDPKVTHFTIIEANKRRLLGYIFAAAGSGHTADHAVGHAAAAK